VVIDNLDLRWPGLSVRPFKANPPPVIDANTILSLPITSQRLKMITRKSAKIGDPGRRFQPVQLQPSGSFNTGESLYPLARREVSRALVSVADDHLQEYRSITRYVKRNGIGGAQALNASSA
jgi:hypothetical protein